MFERFTDGARRAVVTAQEDARERRQDRIRSENLLIGLFDAAASPGAVLLSRLGIDRGTVDRAIRSRTDDTGVLATIGVDLDEVRRQVEQTFGPGALDRGRRRAGHIPFDRPAKRVLEQALHEATLLGGRFLGTEHVLLGARCTPAPAMPRASSPRAVSRSRRCVRPLRSWAAARRAAEGGRPTVCVSARIRAWRRRSPRSRRC